MTTFEKLYIKRFCLPSNIDINNVDYSQLNSCLCGNFYHVSCIFKGKQYFEKVMYFDLWNECNG